jgi:hypothetical protein
MRERGLANHSISPALKSLTPLISQPTLGNLMDVTLEPRQRGSYNIAIRRPLSNLRSRSRLSDFFSRFLSGTPSVLPCLMLVYVRRG